MSRELAIPTLPRDAPVVREMRVAIIVPYRNRAEHLARFVAHFNALAAIGGYIEIFVIEQVAPGLFNRGLLLNAGFLIARRSGPFDRYIFHDVDSYPSPVLYKQYFSFPGRNIHYASPYLKYKYNYKRFVGGVISFNEGDYMRINGFPNGFFGWGGEDDALYNRILAAEVPIWRPSVGSYTLVEHGMPTSGEKNQLKWENKDADRIGWRDDGVAQLYSETPDCGTVTDVRYRRLEMPADSTPIRAPETLLARFRPPKEPRQLHFYAIDWERRAVGGVGGGGRKLSATAVDYADPSADFTAIYSNNGTLGPEGMYIESIRAAPKVGTTGEPLDTPPRIALLFIVQNDMPLLEIWTEWLMSAGGAAFDIFIHAKHPAKLRANLGTHPFANCIVNAKGSPTATKWGSIELTQTMHFLMCVALARAPTCTHMVFLSESCIPVVKPNSVLETARRLGAKSRFRIERIADCTDTKYSLPRQFQSLAREFPEEYVVKSDQWVMLSRLHAAAIAELPARTGMQLWSIFSVIPKATDEMFMPSMLCAALGGLDADLDVDTRPITYKEWEPGAPHPNTFVSITPGLVAKARAEGACFLRKIRAPVNTAGAARLVRGWRGAVLGNR